MLEFVFSVFAKMFGWMTLCFLKTTVFAPLEAEPNGDLACFRYSRLQFFPKSGWQRWRSKPYVFIWARILWIGRNCWNWSGSFLLDLLNIQAYFGRNMSRKCFRSRCVHHHDDDCLHACPVDSFSAKCDLWPLHHRCSQLSDSFPKQITKYSAVRKHAASVKPCKLNFTDIKRLSGSPNAPRATSVGLFQGCLLLDRMNTQATFFILWKALMHKLLYRTNWHCFRWTVPPRQTFHCSFSEMIWITVHFLKQKKDFWTLPSDHLHLGLQV